MISLSSERLLLHEHSIKDAETYARFWKPDPSDPASPPSLNAEDAWARLLRFIGHWSVFGFGPFLVIEPETGMMIGEVGFAHFRRGHGSDYDQAPEAMWKVSRPHQGHGFAKEAIRSSIAWFNRKGFAERTVCMIDKENAASRRIADNVGFVPFREAEYRGTQVLLFERRTPSEHNAS